MLGLIIKEAREGGVRGGLHMCVEEHAGGQLYQMSRGDLNNHLGLC